MSRLPACADDHRVTFTAGDRDFVERVVVRMVGRDDAADVAQEALLTAFRFRDAFRGDSSYRTWLYRIATSTALSFRRSRRSRDRGLTSSLDAELDPELATREPSPEQQLIQAEAIIRARRAIAALPENYASVLRLRFEDELGETEVADALGLSVATVKIRAHRGRLRLRLSLALK
jgi:RNA polymerase sigma-70 factor (ECF subfamily)